MRLSASKTSLALACQWWLRPEVELAPDVPGPAAERGTQIHAWADAYVKGRIFQVPGSDTAWWHLRKWLDGFVKLYPRVDAERAFAYSTRTGEARELDTFEQHRAYGQMEPDEIPGSADLIAHGQTLTVVDIKTGKRKNTEPASENKQMRTLGLMAARAHGVESVHVGLVFVNETGVEEDWTELDDLDLDVHGARLKAALDGAATALPVLGKHCKYCRAKHGCPAWR